MTKILDQYGKPIERAALDEPQTSQVVGLQNQYLTPMLGGLTPARLAHMLHEADNGNLLEQHRMFSDMEERDGHIRAEMDKRKNAIVGLPWSVVPPRNATAAEQANAEWVAEMLQDAVDPIEDLLLAMMDGVGHGFAQVELAWRKEDGHLLPTYHPRPQEWFRLSQDRTAIHLADSSANGAALRPFGWITHTHGKAKTGYAARMGLYRTLVWPFIYKAYALGDFAELLEIFGLPLIVGKYYSGASAEEKDSLMRAVSQLGHNARAIMPVDMQLEIQKVTGGGGQAAHMEMMNWAERSESKSILGQTLSADAGANGGGSFALGKVHNEVRLDIRQGDSRQLAATLTRDLVYPLLALNRPGVDSLARCPRFTFDLGEGADLGAYAEALPKLVGIGVQVPVSWAQDKLRIPVPKDGEAVLAPAITAPPKGGNLAALSVAIPTAAPVANPADPIAEDVGALAAAAAPSWTALLDQVAVLVEQAGDPAVLQQSLVEAFGGQPQAELVKLMGAAFALAELKGMADVMGGH